MSSRWARRGLVAAAVAVVAGVAIGGSGIFGTDHPRPAVDSSRPPAGATPPATARSTTTEPARATANSTSQAGAQVVPAAPLPKTGWVASLRRTISYADKPGGRAAGHVAATDPFGQANVLGIVGVPRADGWAEVELPVRPDGTTAWIRTRAVTLTRTPWWITVDLAARRITVGDGKRIVVTSSVAVGSPSTPTPTGRTYVWESLRPSDPTGPYGPYILGLALYSDALATFNGGPAQIAIHGSNSPATIGQAASNGCVRLPNALVTRLVHIIPLGTPVTIAA